MLLKMEHFPSLMVLLFLFFLFPYNSSRFNWDYFGFHQTLVSLPHCLQPWFCQVFKKAWWLIFGLVSKSYLAEITWFVSLRLTNYDLYSYFRNKMFDFFFFCLSECVNRIFIDNSQLSLQFRTKYLEQRKKVQ